MIFPDTEAELVELPLWIRPPSANPLRQEGPKRAVIFALRASGLPFVKGLDFLNIEDDDDEELFDQAIQFHKIGRQGLYVTSLIYLGLKQNPLACLLLAGIVAQAAKQQYSNSTRSRRQLYRRVVGWLMAIQRHDFDRDFGFDPNRLVGFRKALQGPSKNPDWSSVRRLELNEGKVTVVRNPIRRFRSDTSNSDRYNVLNEPLALAGRLNAKTAAELLKALRDEYPWATDLLSDIETAVALSVSSGRPWLSFPPILIVGPPGIGKTRFIRRLSALSGVPYAIVNAAGLSDNRNFAGTARGWSSAHPSRIVELFVETNVANPIVLVDELDKAGGGETNGRIGQSLLTMLEPETNKRFQDEALATSIDLSFVNWTFTANSVKDLGRPLLSRLRVVHMPPPPPTFTPQILKSAIREVGERYGWTEEMLPVLDPTIVAALEEAVAKGASPRTLVAMLEQIFAIEARWRRGL